MKYDHSIRSLVSTTTDNICKINRNRSNRSSIKTTINHQLNAINFLQEYLENENSDVLIDLLYEIAQEIKLDQYKNYYLHSAMNNNHHHHLTSIFNSNLQLSNNKEKKNKLKN